jgi:diadenosine tetraphosphate (Ap4A) HIT family hydrolase
MAECNRLFERIYTGEKPDKITFRSPDPLNPVYAVLAYQQAAPGHTLITTTECTPRLDMLSERSTRNIAIVNKAVGIWLQAALEPVYVGGLEAGVEVPHAHKHRIPAYGPDTRDWGSVMFAQDPKPFPVMSADELTEVYARSTFAEEYAAVVQNGITSGIMPDSGLLETMAYDLRIPISQD